METRMKLPDSFVKEDYALWVSNKHHCVIEYDTETQKYKLLFNYNENADNGNMDNWELVREFDSMEEICKEFETNKALTCLHFCQNWGNYPTCSECRFFNSMKNECDPTLFD